MRTIWHRPQGRLLVQIEQRWCVLLSLAVAILAGMLLFVPVVHGQDDASGEEQLLVTEPLIVGVHQEPPFAMRSEEGTWDGISIQLWREIADHLGITYEFRQIAHAEIVDDVVDGTLDLAITAVATAEDEQRLDFTHSYFTTPLGIAEREEQGLFDVVRAVLSRQFLYMALWISILLAIVGILVWLFERRNNYEMYGENFRSGLWSGFWWAAVTMSTIGYGDKVPQSTGGRTIALIWMLTAMVITASLTATITSVLTQTSGFQPLSFPEDLRQREVGAVEGTPAAWFLEEESIAFQSYATIQEGVDALVAGDVDVLVDNVASLRYAKSQINRPIRTIAIQETGQQGQPYAFALPNDSSLRETLNRLILRRISGTGWQEVTQRYAPEE